MSRVWDIPFPESQVRLVSRTTINDGFASLLTHFIGAGDISGTPLVDGVVWVNLTSGKLRHRAGGASFDLGDWGVADMGHIRKDGTIAMTAAFDAGSFVVKNLAAPAAANDAARKTDLDAKLAKAGDTLSAAAKLSYHTTLPSLTAAEDLTHKGYVDGKVAKTGDTITGRVAGSSLPAAGTSDLVMKSDVQDLTSFNISTGHRHDGTDSRKVKVGSLDPAGGAVSGDVVVALTASTIGFATANITGAVNQGSYTGDGTSGRQIGTSSVDLDMLFIWSDDAGSGNALFSASAINNTGSAVYGFAASTVVVDGGSAKVAMVNTTDLRPDLDGTAGFKVNAGSGTVGLNKSGKTYNWLGFRRS